MIDECFKLHGVPEWYTELKKNKPQPIAHFADSGGSSIKGYNGPQEQNDQTEDMSKIIQTELAKCMENLMQQHASSSKINGDANLVHEKGG